MVAKKTDVLTAKADFLKIGKPTKVFIESLQKSVYVRSISGSDRLTLMSLIQNASDEDEDPYSLEKMVALGLSDEKGNRIFSDNEAESLSTMPIGSLVEISNHIFIKNKLTADGVKTAKGN